MTLRIRQIVLAAQDLDAVTDHITAVFGAPIAYRDPNVAHFGLRNALFVFGDQFLEVVSPTTQTAAAARHIARHGDSAYMLILQTTDFDADMTRLNDLGVRTVWNSEHPDIKAAHIHPKDIGAAIVSIDQPKVAADWPWCGTDWRQHAATRISGVHAVAVGAVQPLLLADRWAKVLDLPELKDAGEPLLGLERGEIAFQTAASDLMTGFSLVAPDPDVCLTTARQRGLPTDGDSLTIAGCRFHLLTA